MKIDALSQESVPQSRPAGQGRTHQRLPARHHRHRREGELLSMIRESLLSMNRVLTYHGRRIGGRQESCEEARARVRTVQRDVAS